MRFSPTTVVCTIWLACWAMCPTAFGEVNVGFRQVTSTHPVAVQRGTTAEVRLRSNFTLDETHAVFVDPPGLTIAFLESEPIEASRKGRTSPGAPFRFRVEVPEEQLPGVYEYRMATAQAVSSVAQLLVTDFPVVEETSSENGTAEAAQSLEIPVAVCGVCERFEDVDCFRIAGQAGQELTIQIYAQRVTDRLHGMVVRGPRIYLMDPILTLRGPGGQVIAQNDNYFGGDSFLYCRLPADGSYTLEVRDARYAGDPRYTYCVEISSQPYVHSVFPMAIPAGQTCEVELVGAAPGETQKVSLAADAAEPAGWIRRRLDTSGGPTNPVFLRVSRQPTMLESEPNNSGEQAGLITLPLGINGRLSEPDDVDCYKFTARKGEHFRFEVEAQRYGSPLDSVLELFDSTGKLIDEADDIADLMTKDSRLLWTAPADGSYVLAVRDLHDRGDPQFIYHLIAEPAGPDFELFGEYYYAMLAPGTNMLWFARIERQFGFDGPVAVEVENLPPGVSAIPVTIPAGMDHCGIILSAAADAQIAASLVRVRGRATIEGRADGDRTEIVRYGHVFCEQQSSGGGQSRWPIRTQIVGVTRPLDLVHVSATPDRVTLKQGDTAAIDVHITRRDGFADPVTLDMAFTYFTSVLGSQLPPGVTMSDKSQARLTGDVLDGKIILEASPKAAIVRDLPIAVLARVSVTFSITTNYASNPIYLTVEAAGAE